MQLEMTKGNPKQLIITFMMPLLVGNILQQLYGMADTVIVGRYLGNASLAAVGSSSVIMYLISGFLQGFSYAFGLSAAKYFGAGDKERLKKSIGNAILLMFAITVAATLINIVFIDKMLILINTPYDIFNLSKDYIVIIAYGYFATVAYNLSASFLRAIGNSKAPLYFLIMAAIINILLDLLFIGPLNLGIKGAALATIIAQGFSGILCIGYIYLKIPILHIKIRHLKLDSGFVLPQLKIGFPMAMQYSITCVGMIMVQSTLNCLGTFAIASYNAANKFENIIVQPYIAIGIALANYTAQNKGIRDYKRIHSGIKNGIYITIIYAVVSGILINFFVPTVIPLFTNEGVGEILKYAKIFIFLDSIFFIPLGLIFVFRESLQGAGYGFLPMLGGIVELVCRMVISAFAYKYKSFVLICLSNGITWLITAVFISLVYLNIKNKCFDLV